jgi:N-acetyl sugar amidotransferase
MIKIFAPSEIDLSDFSPDHLKPKVLYGLPQDIKFCSSCSYSNQKPNSAKEINHKLSSIKPTLEFDSKGVCSACQISEVKKQIDWNDREKQLKDLCDKYRRNDGSYDCIVPGSGGKDSFYTSFILKYKYNMNPLTVTWAPHMYTTWGWENFQSWIHSGFDNQLFTPNGKVHRLLTRLALEKIFHPFQPFILGQMYMPPRVALELKIPLVFYGENPVEYGNNAGDYLKSAKKDQSFFSSNRIEDQFISGISVDELISDYELTKADLQPYLPLTSGGMQDTELNVQYLGYYLPWHPQDLYYFAVENGGFKSSPERTSGTYSKYSSIDDKIDDFHYYCTYIKFGIGRATYDSAQEIRNGEIERDEAIALIKRYDGEYPKRFENEILEYLSISPSIYPRASRFFEKGVIDTEYFQRLVDNFRSPHLWQFFDGNWSLRKSIVHPDTKP